MPTQQAVLALTLAGFVVTSFAGVNPAWAALAGAASPLFCLFVLALGIVVKAVVDNGLDSGAGHLLPSGTGLPALLAVLPPSSPPPWHCG